ncbi:MAG TPA: hypothetical protein VLC09_14340, partial [Polyangiaceae bacterium]|nr:hypothetical protein [Polyangiaceae bacterium]
FGAWIGGPAEHRVLIIYAPARRRLPAIWLGVDQHGHVLERLTDLPADALADLRRSADGDVPLFPWSGHGQR